MIPPPARFGVESAARGHLPDHHHQENPTMPTPLELRLHQLSRDFARRVAGIISALTIEELAALTAGQDRPATRRRWRTTRPAEHLLVDVRAPECYT
jgi:hypothetical protein